jgi:hypothetical protein
MQPISALSIILLSTGFAYSLVVSWLAYRQTGKQWMLYLPQWIDKSKWIDKSNGVSLPLRLHGMSAFTLLFIAMIVFFCEQS